MTPAPTVSVVITTHNRADVVARAIRSVLGQRDCAFELIVIDDGSTDGTLQAVAAIGDARVRYVRQETARGAGAARNAGTRLAASEFVAFLDDDDEWLPRKLARQLAAAGPGGAGADLVVCGYDARSSAEARVVDGASLPTAATLRASLQTGLHFVPSTWLVRRARLLDAGGFDEALPSCEDWDLAIRLAGSCRIAAVPDVLVVKHGSARSVYGHLPARARGLAAVLTRHAGFWSDNRAARARLEAHVARTYASAGQWGGAIRHFTRALLQRVP